MAAADQTVLYDASEGVARVTLNRPEKRNALNDELIAGLRNALSRAHEDDEVRVIVVAGAGSDFCSGADLAALLPDRPPGHPGIERRRGVSPAGWAVGLPPA